MDQSIYFKILAADPQMLATTGLRMVHFVGLAIGLGSATLLDFIILRFLVLKRMSQESRDIVRFAARFVSIGLVLLWVTGLGFLVNYALTDPGKLMNPKIWAKLSIVAVLTLNGMFIHAAVLPRINAQLDKTLFEGMDRRQRSFLLASGALSAISWYVPVALGAFPQLNYVVPTSTILVSYVVLVVVMTGALHAVTTLLKPVADPQPAPAAAAAAPPGADITVLPVRRATPVESSIQGALDEAFREAETILRDRMTRITLARLAADIRAQRSLTLEQESKAA